MVTVTISSKSKAFDFDIAGLDLKSILKESYDPVIGGYDNDGYQVLTLKQGGGDYVELHGSFNFGTLLKGDMAGVKTVASMTIVEAGKSYTISGLDLDSSDIADAAAFASYVYSKGYKVNGNDFDNAITAADLNDLLTGNGGNDDLFSFGGKDRLSGGSGNDRLDGGDGNDTLLGGSGNDIFLFAEGCDRDVIGDFDAEGRAHDVIDLTDFVGIASLKDITITHTKHDVIIELPSGDEIVISGIDFRDLDKADFEF